MYIITFSFLSFCIENPLVLVFGISTIAVLTIISKKRQEQTTEQPTQRLRTEYTPEKNIEINAPTDIDHQTFSHRNEVNSQSNRAKAFRVPVLSVFFHLYSHALISYITYRLDNSSMIIPLLNNLLLLCFFFA